MQFQFIEIRVYMLCFVDSSEVGADAAIGSAGETRGRLHVRRDIQYHDTNDVPHERDHLRYV